MDILVTGATGYVGSAVAEALGAARHRVIGVARSEESASELREAGFDVVEGDLRGPKGIVREARNAEAVVHVAAPGGQDAAEVDRGFVEAVLDGLRGTAKTFVYTSGGWVMGDTREKMADEDSPVEPPPGMEWRPGVERLVLDALRTHGVRASVVRPALVYGAGGGVVGELVEWAGSHGNARYVQPPVGECYWTLVHRRDLGDFYVRLVEDGGVPGGTLLLAAGSEPIPVREIAATAGRTAGVGGEAAAWPLEEAREELGPYADSLALSQRLSGARARKLLGWSPAAPSVFDELGHDSYSGG